ncbi:hypothetical protein CPC08DRAFT_705791 [Agrocybe pediades]|nr:hypothetical protein CPC08DRAFT_705791 [Agrocybe pediades]
MFRLVALQAILFLLGGSAVIHVTAHLVSAEEIGNGDYGQCGGLEYTGPTVCDTRRGFNCIYVDESRSLCLPLPAQGSTQTT